MPVPPEESPDGVLPESRDLPRVIAAIRDWHDPARRRLSWRDTADPYGVLVSEIMSQQTQAERAGQAWRAFMQRFPTVSVLAAASTADVIAAWAGLGYNRRAVNLHRAAQQIVTLHDGAVPGDLPSLLALPGVGPYTARAVLAFAFQRDVVPVDTNVARVLSRLTGRVLSRPGAQELADITASYGDGPATAAALMDLGASLCRSRTTNCGACPARQRCSWAGGPTPDPAARGAHRPVAQGRFAGSARQARGRVVAALRTGPLAVDEAIALAGGHGEALLTDLVADGLMRPTGDGFALPGEPGKA